MNSTSAAATCTGSKSYNWTDRTATGGATCKLCGQVAPLTNRSTLRVHKAA